MLDFPSAPTVGQRFPSPAVAGVPVYTWDGEKWGMSAPASSGAVRYDVTQTLTAAEKDRARGNISAASWEAMAQSGLQVNGSMEVAVEKGNAPYTVVNGAGPFAADHWQTYYYHGSATAAFTAGRADAGLPGFQNGIYMRCSTPHTGGSTNDIVQIIQKLEGQRVARLMWGTSEAQPITIGFWVSATVAGTFSVAVGNGDGTRAYFTDVTFSLAGGWEWKTVTIPGDTTGTWPKDNGYGIVLMFVFAAADDYRGTPNVWQAGYKRASANINWFFSTSNEQVALTGIVILPGVHTITAQQSVLVARTGGAELAHTQRYYEGNYVGFGESNPNAGGYGMGTVFFKTLKRAVPTIVISITGGANYLQWYNMQATDTATITQVQTAGPGMWYVTGYVNADARLA